MLTYLGYNKYGYIKDSQLFQEYSIEAAKIHVVTKSIYSQLVLCFNLCDKKDIIHISQVRYHDKLKQTSLS